MIIVELGFQLNKSYIYYEKILKEHGLKCVYECVTHDIYYSNNSFLDIDNMTEREIKEACIRIRQVNNGNYEIQNNKFINLKNKYIKSKQLKRIEEKLIKNGFKKVFDTIKIDHQWWKEGMTTRVQLQETKDVGLLVYLDNKKYYEYDLDTQRKKLIDELKSYGFEFKYEDLGLDKLRTLYYREEKYSKNQNG